MRYTQELHERVRQNLRMFDYPRFDDGDIDALLDEIDRLTARVSELEAMTSPNAFNRFMVEKLKDNPELQREFAKTVSDATEYTEVIHKQTLRIAELEAEAEKHRWIPVSERLPKTNKPVYVSCKSKLGNRFHQRAVYIAPKTVLAEEFLDDDYCCDSCQEYDEENDCYCVVEGWWESSLEADVNYKISADVTHWMPLPEPPKEDA